MKGVASTRTAVLAFSGGLDTTCAIAWLKEDYGFDEVVAVLVDVGQAFDLEESIARGRAAGASDILLVDRKEAFANEVVARAVKANALYEGRYPLVSALSRPVIAEAVAAIAEELGAEAVVHGCTGKGNDQLRFELAFKATYPGVKVIAPLRDHIWAREDEVAFAISRGIPVVQTVESPFSIDENLFGRSIEAGVLEDPWAAPPEEPYALTSSPAAAPAPVEVVIGFEHGVPVSLDGERHPLARPDRRAQRAGRRLRDRADRHDREPRGRHQEPRGVRGAGRDRADRGAPRAGGSHAHEGRAAHEAGAGDALDGARLRRPLVQPAAHVDRRVRGLDPGGRDGRGAAAPAARVGGRDRAALGARASTRRRSRRTAAGETFPHEAARGLHQDLVAGDRAAGPAGPPTGRGLTGRVWTNRRPIGAPPS